MKKTIAIIMFSGLMASAGASAQAGTSSTFMLSPSHRISTVSVSFTKEAQDKQDANEVKINTENLVDSVRKALEMEAILENSSDKAGLTMEILIKDLRVRSMAATAAGGLFLMGLATGTDNLTADVTVKNSDGTVLGTYEAYGNGAAGGVMTQSWKLQQLYDGFAREATKISEGRQANSH